MSQLNVGEEVDEEKRGLLESQAVEQLKKSKSQKEEKQVSTNNFTQEIAHPPKQVKSTCNIMSSLTIKETPSSNNSQQISQTKSLHSAIRQSTSEKVKTNTGRKDLLLLIEGPITQQPNQKFNQHRVRRRMIDQEFQNRSNEFYAKLQRQLKNKLKAQIKYLDDKKQERRKAREAKQSQGSFIHFIQAIKQLFSFSKQDKKAQ